MKQYTALQIVNWFRVKNFAELKDSPMAENLTQMKVMKLLYYAQGISLAAFDETLFNDDIVAWKYGPVVEAVHYKYKGMRDIINVDNINESGMEKEALDDFSEISDDEDAETVLETVFEVYGDKSAIDLMNMTHRESPWIDAERNATIPINKIKSYFEDNVLEK